VFFFISFLGLNYPILGRSNPGILGYNFISLFDELGQCSNQSRAKALGALQVREEP
jgi:hypothetical protein